jgi:hypothetical protein
MRGRWCTARRGCLNKTPGRGGRLSSKCRSRAGNYREREPAKGVTPRLDPKCPFDLDVSRTQVYTCVETLCQPGVAPTGHSDQPAQSWGDVVGILVASRPVFRPITLPNVLCRYGHNYAMGVCYRCMVRTGHATSCHTDRVEAEDWPDAYSESFP